MRETMNIWHMTAAALMLLVPAAAGAQAPPGLGSEEFGMTARQLVQAVEQVEQAMQKCMRDQGFQYIAVDYETIRAGMRADKRMGDLSEEEFIKRHGFGVATLYSGLPPQLATGYSPAKVGLGERNVEIYRNLSGADQVAYNRALLGDNPGATFGVALETENLSQTGGCTRQAVEKVFKPEQVKPGHYNPQDALINNDPRMKAALRKFGMEMKKAGFDYNHPDEVEPDIKARLAALTSNGTIPVEKLTATQRADLKNLQDLERRVALLTFKLQDDLLGPVEEKIQQELFARKVQ
jgi:hypothetical protein